MKTITVFAVLAALVLPAACPALGVEPDPLSDYELGLKLAELDEGRCPFFGAEEAAILAEARPDWFKENLPGLTRLDQDRSWLDRTIYLAKGKTIIRLLPDGSCRAIEPSEWAKS